MADADGLIMRNPDGSTEGRHPDEIGREALASLHHGGPIMHVIRAKCLDCCCGQQSEVRKCTAVRCPLWPYRMGTNPFHGARGRKGRPDAFVRKIPTKDGEIRQEPALILRQALRS
jgi:hypothetical protein